VAPLHVVASVVLTRSGPQVCTFAPTQTVAPGAMPMHAAAMAWHVPELESQFLSAAQAAPSTHCMPSHRSVFFCAGPGHITASSVEHVRPAST